MVKRILAVVVIVVILIGVGGCMEKQNEISVNEQVEKYMKDKYHEEFKVTGGGTESWDSNYKEIYVSSEKFPEGNIMIRRDIKSGEMIDNYMNFLMKNKIEAAIHNIVSEIYPESKVLFDTSGSPLVGASPEMNADEYMKYLSDYINLSLTICINDGQYKENKAPKLEQLRVKFKEKQYRPSFTIMYISDDKLKQVNDSNIQDLLNNYPHVANWILLRGDFDMDESYDLRICRWGDVK